MTALAQWRQLYKVVDANVHRFPTHTVRPQFPCAVSCCRLIFSPTWLSPAWVTVKVITFVSFLHCSCLYFSVWRVFWLALPRVGTVVGIWKSCSVARLYCVLNTSSMFLRNDKVDDIQNQYAIQFESVTQFIKISWNQNFWLLSHKESIHAFLKPIIKHFHAILYTKTLLGFVFTWKLVR